MFEKRSILIVVVLVLTFSSSCQPYRPTQENDNRWKSFSQLEKDLKAITTAGYRQVCLFDLKDIKAYPDPRYVALLKEYVEAGLELTVYVQQIDPSQETLDLVRNMGATAVIVYEEELASLFRTAGIETCWWSGVAFPHNHTQRPQYMEWPDLRDENVREDIANWVVAVPQQVDGGLCLDYVRWNDVGDGRSAAQITDLVERIAAKWELAGNGILSAAVYPYFGKTPEDGGARSVGQAWDEWLARGLVDAVYPMAYSSADIPGFIRAWKPYPKDKVVPCLSVINY